MESKQSQDIKILAPMSSLQLDEDCKTVSILSYNTLYKDWVNKERYPFIKDETFRTWEYRLPRILDTISKYSSDIVCLQEVDVDPIAFKKDFGDYFNEKFNYQYALSPCKTMKVKKRESDGHWGNAVLFNSNKFKLIHMEFLKKSPREMVLLFTNISDINQCKKCQISNICCIYHSFFVINVHFPGHPNKWRSRLNAIQRIINKMKTFGYKHKSPKIEKKTVKINTNINGNWKNMKIIFCGDFNAPKTGNVDNFLIKQGIDINNYNQTRNIYEEAKQNENENKKDDEQQQNKPNINKKIIRFLCPTKIVGAIVGKQGVIINEIRKKSQAGIWIFEASKGRYGLNGQSVISIKGTSNIITTAINLCLDKMPKQQTKSLRMLMESTNIDMFGITKGIINQCNVTINISSEPLIYSTEKIINIEGHITAIKSAVSILVNRWFDNNDCIDTQKIYNPEMELDANCKHGFDFKDSYHEAMVQLHGDQKLDAYYDRMKYFPTYGDGIAFGAMDYVYYTANNIELMAITKTLDENSYGDLKGDIEKECELIKKRMINTEEDKHKQQGVLSKVLELPNDKLVSDHLPIGVVFKLKDVCHDNNKECDKCECMGVNGGRLRGKINKNKKKKRNKLNKDGNQNGSQNENSNTNKCLFDEMRSF